MSLPDLPEVPRERRGTATVVAVGALGVLCVLGLFLGLRGLTAPADPEPAAVVSTPTSTGTPMPSPTITRTASPRPSPTATTPADQVAFSSPSGNIRCVVSSAGARCGIRSRAWQAPPRPDTCRQTWGRDLYVTARGGGFACTSGAVPAGPGLGYGREVSRGGFSCTSTPDGITCTSRTGRGFTVSRTTYDIR